MEELERCVKKLKFIGWKTHSNFGDSYLDEKKYWPLLAKAEELGALIYVHPDVPIMPQFRTCRCGLAGPSFGYGVEASLVVMRLAILVLIAGLALLVVDKEVAITVLVASTTLAILGVAAAQEDDHRDEESADLLQCLLIAGSISGETVTQRDFLKMNAVGEIGDGAFGATSVAIRGKLAARERARDGREGTG